MLDMGNSPETPLNLSFQPPGLLPAIAHVLPLSHVGCRPLSHLVVIVLTCTTSMLRARCYQPTACHRDKQADHTTHRACDRRLRRGQAQAKPVPIVATLRSKPKASRRESIPRDHATPRPGSGFAIIHVGIVRGRLLIGAVMRITLA